MTHPVEDNSVIRMFNAAVAEVEKKILRGDAKDYLEYRTLVTRREALLHGKAIVITEINRSINDEDLDDGQ